MKTCNKCVQYLAFEMFSKDKSKADGLCTICKNCKSSYRKAYYAKNADAARENAIQWYHANKEAAKAANMAWSAKNRDRKLAARRLAHKRNYKADSAYRLSHVMRAALRGLFDDIGKPKSGKTFAVVGYPPEKLKARLEVNFTSGMGWENYGEWEIDHKIPMSVMLAQGETRPSDINDLYNLQPMWKDQNRKKGNRWVG